MPKWKNIYIDRTGIPGKYVAWGAHLDSTICIDNIKIFGGLIEWMAEAYGLIEAHDLRVHKVQIRRRRMRGRDFVLIRTWPERGFTFTRSPRGHLLKIATFPEGHPRYAELGKFVPHGRFAEVYVKICFCGYTSGIGSKCDPNCEFTMVQRIMEL